MFALRVIALLWCIFSMPAFAQQPPAADMTVDVEPEISEVRAANLRGVAVEPEPVLEASGALDKLKALQTEVESQTPSAEKPLTQVPPRTVTDHWEANELTIGSMILGYGLIVIGISAWLMVRGKDSEAVLRMVAVISAVVLSGFLLVVGYDDKQMNPVIGLLGTIVGYLLGKEQGYTAAARDDAQRKTETPE